MVTSVDKGGGGGPQGAGADVPADAVGRLPPGLPRLPRLGLGGPAGAGLEWAEASSSRTPGWRTGPPGQEPAGVDGLSEPVEGPSAQRSRRSGDTAHHRVLCGDTAHHRVHPTVAQSAATRRYAGTEQRVYQCRVPKSRNAEQRRRSTPPHKAHRGSRARRDRVRILEMESVMNIRV